MTDPYAGPPWKCCHRCAGREFGWGEQQLRDIPNDPCGEHSAERLHYCNPFRVDEPLWRACLQPKGHDGPHDYELRRDGKPLPPIQPYRVVR